MRILKELEVLLERKVCEYAESLGMLVLKFTPAGQAGWPDRVFITRTGLHIYVEFKRANENLRKLQEHRRWQLQQHGCLVYGPVDNLEQAKEILDYYAAISAPEAGVDSP